MRDHSSHTRRANARPKSVMMCATASLWLRTKIERTFLESGDHLDFDSVSVIRFYTFRNLRIQYIPWICDSSHTSRRTLSLSAHSTHHRWTIISSNTGILYFQVFGGSETTRSLLTVCVGSHPCNKTIYNYCSK